MFACSECSGCSAKMGYLHATNLLLYLVRFPQYDVVNVPSGFDTKHGRYKQATKYMKPSEACRLETGFAA